MHKTAFNCINMSLVIDLNMAKVCLVCLQDDCELRSVYVKDEQTPEMTIADKISQCSELWVQERISEKLPNKICDHCVDDLAATWRFRENCENANVLFRTIEQQELADFEIEIQNLKLPTGLKIAKITSSDNKEPTKNNQTPIDKKIIRSHHIDAAAAVVTDPDCEEEEDNEHDGSKFNYDDAADDDNNELISDDAGDHYYETEVVCAEENVENEEHLEDENFGKGDENQADTTATDKTNSKKPYERKVHKVEQKGESVLRRNRGRPKKKIDNEHEDDDFIDVNIGNVRDEDDASNTNENIMIKKVKLSKTSIARSLGKRKVQTLEAKICAVCGNTYKYQHALDAHMRRHNNDRPFSCEFCQKAFVSGVELRRHMRVHTGHKPYGCQYCDRRFSDFGSRLKHERTHTGERPYVCGTCGKSFAYAHVLSVHLRTHTGEKRFKCTHCGRGFTKKVYLEAHMQQHDRSEVLSQLEEVSREDDSTGYEEIGTKSVAFEECIFTTEYVPDNPKEEEKYEIYEVEEIDENMSEEHLEEDENSKTGRDFK